MRTPVSPRLLAAALVLGAALFGSGPASAQSPTPSRPDLSGFYTRLFRP